MTGEIFIENLQVALTPEERMFKGEELAQAMLELEELEQEKERFNKSWKSRNGEVEDKFRALGRTVREGKEWRDVECFESPEYSTGRVNIVRRDTGDTIRDRAMHPTERQQGIRYAEGENCEPPNPPGTRKLASSNRKHDRAKSATEESVDTDGEDSSDDDDGDEFRGSVQ